MWIADLIRELKRSSKYHGRDRRRRLTPKQKLALGWCADIKHDELWENKGGVMTFLDGSNYIIASNGTINPGDVIAA